MGRKMGLRGRPGLLFLALVLVFIIVFILSWRSIRTPEKQEVKDIYSSVNLEAIRRREQGNSDQHPFNDFQNAGKGLYNQENIDKDLQYQLGKDFMIERAKMDEKMNSADTNVKKVDESPLSVILHSENSKHPKTSANVQNCKSVSDAHPFYHEVDPSSRNVLDSLQRLVHIDLKGAPPKLSYFQKLFPLLTKLGATGLLIEYEDTFPYSGSLRNISAINSYTPQQIAEILALARRNRLSVIPFIQTFGHMEFVLKSIHLRNLRESEYTPQVINIASKESYELVRNLIKQILAAHPSISYLHIGCDEVYELGRGKSSNVMIRERIGTEDVFLRHVKQVAQIVAQESKGKVRPIMWDDELRSIPENVILESKLPSHVDIMVWKYTTNISKVLDEALWKKYGRLFKHVWTASSFKGATGARQIYTEAQYHIQNHFSWIETFTKFKDTVHFKGIVLTGWSRYDHFATLCELFPVAIPSLAVCLASLKNGGFNEEIHGTISKVLNCSNHIEMSFPELDPKTKRARVTQDCRFPGYMIYYAMQQLWGCRQQGQEAKEAGWLSDYHMSHRFSNPGQLKVMAMKLSEQHSNFIQASTPLQETMSQIYSDDTIEEWMDENIHEQIHHIKDTQEKIKTLLSQIHWERRPLEKVLRLPTNVKVDGVLNGAKTQQKNSGSINLGSGQHKAPSQFDMHPDAVKHVPKQPPSVAHINAGNNGIRSVTNIKTFQVSPGSNEILQKRKAGIAQGEMVRGAQSLPENAGKPLYNRKIVRPDNGGHHSDLSYLQNKTPSTIEKKMQKKRQPLDGHLGFYELKSPVVMNKGEKIVSAGDNFKTKMLPQSKFSAQANFPQKLNPSSSNANVVLEKLKKIPGDNISRNFKDIPLATKSFDNDKSNFMDKSKNIRKTDLPNVKAHNEDFNKLMKPLNERMRKTPAQKEYNPRQDNVLVEPDESEELDNREGRPGNEDDTLRRRSGKQILSPEPALDQDWLPTKDKSGLSPEFVEALRKSHYAMSNQDSINKELFPHLEQDLKEDS